MRIAEDEHERCLGGSEGGRSQPLGAHDIDDAPANAERVAQPEPLLARGDERFRMKLDHRRRLGQTRIALDPNGPAGGFLAEPLSGQPFMPNRIARCER